MSRDCGMLQLAVKINHLPSTQNVVMGLCHCWNSGTGTHEYLLGIYHNFNLSSSFNNTLQQMLLYVGPVGCLVLMYRSYIVISLEPMNYATFQKKSLFYKKLRTTSTSIVLLHLIIVAAFQSARLNESRQVRLNSLRDVWVCYDSVQYGLKFNIVFTVMHYSVYIFTKIHRFSALLWSHLYE